MVKIGPLRNTKAYLKAGALALLVSASTCIKRPALTKDIVEFSHPQAAKLIQKLEAGDRHSATIYLDEAAERLITKKQMKEYRKVPQRILDTLKTLPDTMEVYYQVYKGKADSYIQKQLQKADSLLTVGHGNTGRGYITLAGEKKAYEGDYISQYAADSLFNNALNQKDSILRANISKKAYKKLKNHEKDATLSYLYNVNETLLSKHNDSRTIPESFFECLENGDRALAQAKFNVMPSSKAVKTGLAKRNLIQMLVFGNGKIYKNEHAQENLHNMLDIIDKKVDSKRRLEEIFDIVKAYGVNEKNLEKTKQEIAEYLSSK